MTGDERQLLARIHDCVSRLGTVGPRNPSDIAGLARADRLVSREAPQLALAISHLGFGELNDASDQLDRVEQALGVRI